MRGSVRKGHTLVEIMIVVAIIGLLLAIAVPNFINARTSAARSACLENLRLLDGAIHTYRIDTGQWPTMIGQLAPYVINTLPTRCPDDGSPYTVQMSGGVAYTNCPQHGNVMSF